MTDATASEAQPKQEWLTQFWADEQKRADAAGMNIIEYQTRANGGILKPTIVKMLSHAKAHPDACPSDCAFQASIKSLKERHDVR